MPAVAWNKLDNQSEIAQSAVSGGKLQLKHVTGSDRLISVFYNKHPGRFTESGVIIVNGKLLVMITLQNVLFSLKRVSGLPSVINGLFFS